MGSANVGVQCRLHHHSPRAMILRLPVDCVDFFFFLMSSNHSLHGFPLLVSPSIDPNIASFTVFILPMFPNKFSFPFYASFIIALGSAVALIVLLEISTGMTMNFGIGFDIEVWL